MQSSDLIFRELLKTKPNFDPKIYIKKDKMEVFEWKPSIIGPYRYTTTTTVPPILIFIATHNRNNADLGKVLR